MLKIIFWTIITATVWLAGRYIISCIIKRRRQFDEYEKVLANGKSDAYRLTNPDYLSYPCKDYIPFSELPSLPIEQFIRFYSVDPSKWQLTKGCAYRTDNYSAAIFFKPFSNYLKYEKFRKDTAEKYKKIAKEKADREDKMKQDKNLETLLNLVQKDIDNAFEESRKELEKAAEITKKVTTNMKGG